MAADKFVNGFLILCFLGCFVRNGFCAPIEDAVVLSDGTVLKMVINDVVEAPPPRFDNELDGNEKDENELAIVILEAQSAPPPHIISKRDVEEEEEEEEGGDDNGGDEDSKTDPTVLPTANSKSAGELVKTSTPSMAADGIPTTTALGLQKQISNEIMISESPKSETQVNVGGQPAGNAGDNADEDVDSKEQQESTIPTALPTRPFNNRGSSVPIDSKDGSTNQVDSKNNAGNKENNTSSKDVDDQSNKDVAKLSNESNNKLNDDSIDHDKLLGENSYDKGKSDENNDDLDDTADEHDRMNNDGDGNYEDDVDEDDNRNHLNAAESPALDVTEEEGAENDEDTDNDGEPSESGRSDVVKENISESQSSGHFMSYFLIAVVFVACFYLVFHNRQKIKAYVLEGRNGRGRRRKAGDNEYRQLSTAEEVLPSADKGMESKTTYTY